MHPVLGRQLRRLKLGDEDPPGDRADWTAFLSRVESAYATADQERYLLERSFDLSSEEMRELHASLQRREAEQAALRRVATAVAADEDPESIFLAVARESASVVGAGAGRVFHFDGDRGHLVGSWGSRPELSATTLGDEGMPLDGATATARVFQTGDACRVDDYGALDDSTAESLADRSFRCGVAAPVRVHGELWGAVAAMSTAEVPLPESAEASFVHFANLVALAIGSSEARAELARQAMTDPLTDLPNRTLFDDRLAQALAMRRRDARGAAILLMDLDRFKDVNDTLGHGAGDALLHEVAQRLSSALRESDTLARLGGDEFAIVLPECPDEAGALAVVEKLRGSLGEPFSYGGLLLEMEGSFGVSLFPEHGTTPEELVQHADVAMYVAKNGRAGVNVYSPGQDEHSPERLALVGELRRAIDEHELVVEYQPKIDIRVNRPIGMEALVRWRHPTRGMLGPGAFIPIAERTALIKPLTIYVLEAALHQCAKWSQGEPSLVVSVNVSAASLGDPTLPTAVSDALQRARLTPDHLELEITESALMIDPQRSLSTLAELRRLGVSISIDDFGTGYSSLSYLKDLPVNVLKIDRSFVSKMDVSEADAMIVRSTVDLAHNLGLTTVAEGVEEGQHLSELRRLGCDAVQGFLLARPMPAVEAGEWLEAFDLGDLLADESMESSPGAHSV